MTLFSYLLCVSAITDHVEMTTEMQMVTYESMLQLMLSVCDFVISKYISSKNCVLGLKISDGQSNG